MASDPQRTALVTGGSGDLGRAIATLLAAAGHHVIVHANQRLPAAEEVVQAIVQSGGSAQAVQFDVTDADATRHAIDDLLAQQPIAIVVNNAGIHDDGPMAGMGQAQWHRVIDVSLHGFFNVTQPLLLPMARGRWGRIINVSSVAGIIGNRGQVNYAAAKSALHGATRSLAREMASRNITVNVVAPGVIAGSMTEDVFTADVIKQMVPAGRAGKPEDVAALVNFLCTDAASYINGQIIGVNGGMA